MASPAQAREGLTLEEFLRLPEEKPYLEYINGRVEEKVSPQKKHGQIQGQLLQYLNHFARPAGLGMAFPELRCTFSGRSIVPDVVFLLKQHIEIDEQGEPVDLTLRAPDLHVEIVAPDQRIRLSHEKLVHSTGHGCELGLLTNPYQKTIDVYRAGRAPERLADDGIIDGEPVLPGLRLAVAEVFGWLKLKF